MIKFTIEIETGIEFSKWVDAYLQNFMVELRLRFSQPRLMIQPTPNSEVKIMDDLKISYKKEALR